MRIGRPKVAVTDAIDRWLGRQCEDAWAKRCRHLPQVLPGVGVLAKHPLQGRQRMVQQGFEVERRAWWALREVIPALMDLRQEVSTGAHIRRGTVLTKGCPAHR